MLVRDVMTSHVVTVSPETPAGEALTVMTRQHIRRLPVLQETTLVGIVTRADLLRAAPAAAVRGSAADPERGMRGMAVKHAMSPTPVTIAPDVTIEDAAVLMREHRIGALPVLDQGALAGIITESDIFDAFIKVMGLRSGGTRLTIKQDDGAAVLKRVVDTVHDCQAGILSLAAYRMSGVGWIVVRVDAPVPLHVVQTLVERGINVTHLAPLPAGRGRRRGDPARPDSRGQGG